MRDDGREGSEVGMVSGGSVDTVEYEMMGKSKDIFYGIWNVL
jgi:hypothetical protein